MAGIGIQLNRIFNKHTVTSSLQGIGYSVVVTIAPMLLIMGSLLAMYSLLRFDSVPYLERELFSCTVLYVFIFSLLFSSAFNSTLSKYIADRVFENRIEDIKPCLLVGLAVKLGVSSLIAIPFYIWEIVVGKVAVYYVFTSYMCYISLTLVFALMLYGVVIKQFKRISQLFLLGSAVTVLLSVVFHYLFGMSITYSMLLALTLGFWLTAMLQLYVLMRRFTKNSHRYRPVFAYFKQYSKLIITDFLYIFGLFAHNFVFWTVPWRLEIVNTYVCNQPYDMATCLAMFTNITATVLFVTKVEMHFFDHYSQFNSSVVGGSLDMVDKAKDRMFRSLSQQIQELVRLQFTISVIVFLLAEILLPSMGLGGMTMDIYPLMAVGYFISFLMYSNILFLQYYTDYTGSAITGVVFAAVSVLGAIPSTQLSAEWYGLGYVVASLLAYLYSFFRLCSIEKNLYTHIFCVGSLLKTINKDMPSAEVYHRDRPLDGQTSVRENATVSAAGQG